LLKDLDFCKIYIIKEFVQPKMSLNNREFLIWKERGRGWAGILKVRLGLGEVEERDRDTER
jgi:hypothetical protein